ncbi:mismatch repair endonuclease PMS2-like isoform X1 [Haliotis rufescens]|uniref:mismatch repair endonuclease PMS2-like isoform X1 n=2 Tax=Haliotis rufescens TaxID=6454 RepID=UPI00201F6F33|nr:mismatch repair endonuclease PMS2-like isoform X1 [Haliotis rufescens]
MAEKEKTDYIADETSNVPEATTEKAGSIQAIDRGSVHRICSGQVVLTLAIAVKELVENSVDAKATSVEVKLKEYGSEMIEVSDNGSGVEEKNFEGLTLKHHTSKIQDFGDLVGVETFGFRGEALSSLCALSKLSVVTCHEEASVGTRLEFDHHGTLCSRAPCPRQKGTTVILQNLFSTLPVRHREFQRSLKKEFAKMIQVLNAYCLVTTGVRISCTNQAGKGSRSTVVSTKGNTTLRENIANIFGPKQVQSLLEFKQHEPTEEVCSWFGVKSQAYSEDLFRIEGFVSKCEHGRGRGSTDRQFIFINKRPCDSAKLSKQINEVYHSYNRHQYPFVVLTITMDKESVDVNVTPDKRQLFLQGEKLLLATLKTSLVKMFEPTTSILKINTFMTLNTSRADKDDDSSDTGSDRSLQVVPEGPKIGKPTLVNTLSKLKRSFSSAFAKDDVTGNFQTSSPEHSKQRRLDTWTLPKSQSLPAKFKSEETTPCKSSLSNFLCKQSPNFGESESVIDSDSGITESPSKLSHSPSLKTRADDSFSSPVSAERGSHVDSFLSDFKQKCTKDVTKVEGGGSSQSSDCVIVVPEQITSSQGSRSTCCSQGSKTDSFTVPDTNLEYVQCEEDTVDARTSFLKISKHSSQEIIDLEELSESSMFRKARLKGDTGEEEEVEDVEEEASHLAAAGLSGEASQESPDDAQLPHGCQVTLQEYDEKEEVRKRERRLSFSFSAFKARTQAVNGTNQDGNGNTDFSRSFRAKISPLDNRSAEEELQREIKKDMFPKMEIIGQFNLGFILAKHGEDLFIVDQHATDEKYNFEMLQRHTVIQSQKLIHPQNLELTASNETILVDNLDIFRKNGFDFVIDETAPPTCRVKLTSTPVSKNWNFGKDDIEELIFMLTDSPGVMCRPSRVRMMFASRACRKSIMIGTALNKAEMKKLLCHMGEIEQPWNCPHGRPTMRHLFNLNMLPK